MKNRDRFSFPIPVFHYLKNSWFPCLNKKSR